MSSPDSEDLSSDLAAAKERDLVPLVEESCELLQLDYEQATTLEDYLDLAWLSGSRSARDQAQVHVRGPRPNVKARAIVRLETEFKILMEDSANALNLTVGETITMWHYLQEAWMAGNRTCEAEFTELIAGTEADVAGEALKWLEEKDESS